VSRVSQLSRLEQGTHKGLPQARIWRVEPGIRTHADRRGQLPDTSGHALGYLSGYLGRAGTSRDVGSLARRQLTNSLPCPAWIQAPPSAPTASTVSSVPVVWARSTPRPGPTVSSH